MMAEKNYTDTVRTALLDAIERAPLKNKRLPLADRIIALLYINGFKIVPVDKSLNP